MSISLSNLDPDFRAKVETLLERCRQRGVVMTPYCAIRTPFEQGKLWRQSRTIQTIRAKLSELRRKGAPFLAHCIESVGPQNGPPVTGAVPGLSWHQWGVALDCFWRINNVAEWSPDRGGPANGYRIYAHEASLLGLTAGGYWQSLKDWPHVQKLKSDSPDKAGRTLAEIDAEMQRRFG